MQWTVWTGRSRPGEKCSSPRKSEEGTLTSKIPAQGGTLHVTIPSILSYTVLHLLKVNFPQNSQISRKSLLISYLFPPMGWNRNLLVVGRILTAQVMITGLQNLNNCISQYTSMQKFFLNILELQQYHVNSNTVHHKLSPNFVCLTSCDGKCMVHHSAVNRYLLLQAELRGSFWI